MEMIEKKYFGCLIKQRVDENCPKFFVFYARAREVIKWAGFRRAEKHQTGTQRSYRESRLEAIAKYLKSNPINTLPNDILVAFDQTEDKKANFTSISSEEHELFQDEGMYNGCGELLQWGFINFQYDPEIERDENKEHLKTAIVIDGQHRLLGILRQEEDVPILLVAILDSEAAEQAFQFIVINNKAVRVPTSNVKGIVSDIAQVEPLIIERLLKAGVRYGKNSPLLHEVDTDENSPFKALLDWTSNREGNKLVPVTAIEQCISLYKKTFNKMSDDEDSQRETLFAIWNSVKKKFESLWGNDDNYLMKKVSINALNELFVERLKFLSEYGLLDIFDPEDIEKKSHEIISKINPIFWSTTWTIAESEQPLKVQDNANVRALIKRDLEQIIDNLNSDRDWFENLKLIKPNEALISSED